MEPWCLPFLTRPGFPIPESILGGFCHPMFGKRIWLCSVRFSDSSTLSCSSRFCVRLQETGPWSYYIHMTWLAAVLWYGHIPETAVFFPQVLCQTFLGLSRYLCLRTRPCVRRREWASFTVLSRTQPLTQDEVWGLVGSNYAVCRWRLREKFPYSHTLFIARSHPNPKTLNNFIPDLSSHLSFFGGRD